MKKYLDVLKSCSLFQGITSEEMLALFSCLGGISGRYSKGQTILREGDPGRWIGVVLAGRVQIRRTDYFGSRSILMALEPGQIFGESFACAESPALPVEAVATEQSEILLLDCHRMLKSCSSACSFHNQMIFNLMKGMAAKNLAMNQKLELLSKRTTREKLMTYLLMQAKARNSSRFTIPFDRQELADYLGVERSGLSAEIGKLQREGVLETNRSSFQLLETPGEL